MTLKEAAEKRHMVRQYEDKPLTDEAIEALEARISEANKKHNLSMKLVTGEGKGVWGVMKVVAKNVKNYIVLAGDPSDDLNMKIGYASADLMLYAQTLGLNTWWVGGTYNRSVAHHVEGKKVIGIVAVGYGATQGVQHKSKAFADVASYAGEMPEWFKEGVKYALLAPTALNKQGFHLEGEGNKVKLTFGNGMFDATDAGIVKYHFELGAGESNFDWQ